MYRLLPLLLAASYKTVCAQTSNTSTDNYVLPMYDSAPSDRQQQLAEHREGYIYGPSLLGNMSFFPTGSLGDALVAEELDLFFEEGDIFQSIIDLEAQEVITTLAKACDSKLYVYAQANCSDFEFQHIHGIKSLQRRGPLVLPCALPQPVAGFESRRP